MINSNEIRIGNFIADRGGKIWQIDNWESHNKVASKGTEIVIDGKSYGFGHPLTEEIDFLQPIPLTPELLEKAGFKNISKGSNLKRLVYEKGSLWINVENKKFTAFHKSMSTASCISQIEYLHTLQNLYFALSGIELTINL